MTEKRFVPIGNWTPDTGILQGAADVKGCLSLSGRYAPLADLEQVAASALLNDPCIGGRSFYSSTGQVNAFVGDKGRIYKMVGKNPTDVSKAGGYTAAPDWVWNFEQFGDNIVAVARGAPMQRYILGSSSAFDDLVASTGSVPTADVVFRIRSQLFACAGITVNVAGFNNITQWLPDVGVSAFQTTLPQANGIVMAGIGGEQGTIFQERGIVRVTFTGADIPYIFDEVEGGRGCCSPNGVSVWGKNAYVVAEDGFYLWDGLNAVPIGENKVDRYFVDNVNYAYRSRIWASVDATKKSWMVAFPTGGSTIPNEVLIYSWADNRWTHDTFKSQYGFELHRAGISGDDQAALEALFGTAVADDPAYSEISIDSPIFSESRKRWCVVDDNRKIMQFTGANRPATFYTPTFEPSPGKKTFVSELWPIADADPAAITGTVYSRLNTLNETETVWPSAPGNTFGFCEARAEGRYVRARFDIAAGTAWTEVTGAEVNPAMGGER